MKDRFSLIVAIVQAAGGAVSTSDLEAEINRLSTSPGSAPGSVAVVNSGPRWVYDDGRGALRFVAG